MSIGKPERETQNRVIALFRDELGYRCLGDWSDRDNSNIDEKLLAAHLAGCGYTPEQISRAIYLLRTEADNPKRQALMEQWYREELKSAALALAAKWERLMGVKVQRMFDGCAFACQEHRAWPRERHLQKLKLRKLQ